ncbi:MAG: 4-hydroxythreonine-4-phosphate dehydrogenase PdxA [Thermodesulfobacteriota bacterium]
MKPKIALTMGDPAGVGPELILKALADESNTGTSEIKVFGDLGVLNFLAGKLGLKGLDKDIVHDLSSINPEKIQVGSAGPECGHAAIRYVEEAVRAALSGSADAVVTAPINKETAKKAGFKFPGHTEFLAHLTGAKDYRMMLGGADLKVVLVTIHVPLKDVPGLITTQGVFKTIEIAHESLINLFGIRDPKIAVAGLNPHAGEGGYFGGEEAVSITPAIEKARSLGMDVTGPLPSDTVFYRAVRKKEFHTVVCMYHDQGLAPLKLIHFEDGFNTTLGLPIIRTSPDHGTAYDIAWKGIASPASLTAAIETAVEMVRNKNRMP